MFIFPPPMFTAAVRGLNGSPFSIFARAFCEKSQPTKIKIKPQKSAGSHDTCCNKDNITAKATNGSAKPHSTSQTKIESQPSQKSVAPKLNLSVPQKTQSEAEPALPGKALIKTSKLLTSTGSAANATSTFTLSHSSKWTTDGKVLALIHTTKSPGLSGMLLPCPTLSQKCGKTLSPSSMSVSISWRNVPCQQSNTHSFCSKCAE